MNGWTLAAPAKINLHLEVLGRRPDGYHLLRTVFQALELADQLSWAPGSGGTVLETAVGTPRARSVDSGPDNLVCRAARAWRERTGISGGDRFHLVKRIPPGAGLGGGSSDAAAALMLLQHAHGAPLDAATVAELALELGADVPFFLVGGTCWGEGVGDCLTPVPGPPVLEYLLLLPPFGCATAEVFKNFAAQWIDGRPDDRVGGVKASSHKELALPSPLENQLEPAACSAYPQLAALRREIVAAGHAAVRMSGSGSTLFLSGAAETMDGAALDLAFLHERGVERLRTRSRRSGMTTPVPWTGGVPRGGGNAR